MTNYKQIRKKPGKQDQNAQAGPIQVNGISGIPFEATSQDIFRLLVDVEEVIERETKTGNPYYFLQCRDEEGMMLSVIVWDWQWANLEGQMEEGTKLELDVKAPKQGFSAFTLA
jgi:DNA polymerase III alpha subunit